MFRRLSGLTGERLLRVVCLAMTQLALARTLGLEEYGRYSVVSSFVVVVAAVGSLGMDSGWLQRQLLDGDSRQTRALFQLRLLAGLASALLAALLLWSSGAEPSTAVILLGAAIGALSLQELLEAPTLVYGGLAQLLPWRIAVTLTATAGKCLAGLYLRSLEAVLAIWLVELLVQLALHRTLGRLPAGLLSAPTRSSGLWPMWLATGLPLWLSAIAMLAYSRFDQLLISHWLGPSVLAPYAAALRVFELAFVLQQAVITALLGPYFTQRALGADRGRAFLQQVGRPLALVTPLFMLAGWLLAPGILEIAFGAAYAEEGAPLLRILLLALPAIAWGVLRALWIYAENLAWLALAQNTFAAALSLSLNYLLTPKLGPAAAAAIYVTSLTTAFVATGFAWPRMRNLHLQLRGTP